MKKSFTSPVYSQINSPFNTGSLKNAPKPCFDIPIIIDLPFSILFVLRGQSGGSF